MKKFLLFLAVLIAAACAVFFVGWVSFAINGDEYAVVYTKSGGWREEVVIPGRFAWMWERIIPTNLSLYRFPAAPRHLETTVRGELPSGSIYARLLDEQPDFSYEFELEVSFSIRPEALPSLVRDGGLRPETLDAWYDTTCERIARYVLGRMPDSLASQAAEPLSVSFRAEGLSAELEKEFPEIELHSITPGNTRFPDPELYTRGKRLYLSVLDARETALARAGAVIASERASDERAIERLEALGDVLTRYPVLIQYFAVNAGLEPFALPLPGIAGTSAPDAAVGAQAESGGPVRPGE
jgi:hypothetical protein